jgi:hypothetical protein
MALRPDSFCDYSVKRHMEECAQEDVHKNMKLWYEIAVDEQKKELKEYKKKKKAQVMSMPLIIVEDLSQEQNSPMQDSS